MVTFWLEFQIKEKSENQINSLVDTFFNHYTVFKNHRKSLIQHFWKSDSSGQTVLPDRSILVRQKLMKNTKFQKLKYAILIDFQTLCIGKF